jgi:hypothetical protein
MVLEREVECAGSLTRTPGRKRSDLLRGEFHDLVGEVVLSPFGAVECKDSLVDLFDSSGEAAFNASLNGGHLVLDSLRIFFSGVSGGFLVSGAMDEEESSSDGPVFV